jgi:hypothetical protein
VFLDHSPERLRGVHDRRMFKVKRFNSHHLRDDSP